MVATSATSCFLCTTSPNLNAKRCERGCTTPPAQFFFFTPLREKTTPLFFWRFLSLLPARKGQRKVHFFSCPPAWEWPGILEMKPLTGRRWRGQRAAAACTQIEAAGAGPKACTPRAAAPKNPPPTGEDPRRRCQKTCQARARSALVSVCDSCTGVCVVIGEGWRGGGGGGGKGGATAHVKKPTQKQTSRRPRAPARAL